MLKGKTNCIQLRVLRTSLSVTHGSLFIIIWDLEYVENMVPRPSLLYKYLLRCLQKIDLWFFLQDPSFYVLKEDVSPCIFGSIEKQRWSYACAKQLIERLVYGKRFLIRRHVNLYNVVRTKRFHFTCFL